MKRFRTFLCILLCLCLCLGAFAACAEKKDKKDRPQEIEIPTEDPNGTAKPQGTGQTTAAPKPAVTTPPKPSDRNTAFVIGATGPLTGPAAFYGNEVKRGAELAVAEINAAGGLKGGKFTFLMVDDQHQADRIDSAYADLYEQGMQVSIGSVTSAPALEFVKKAQSNSLFIMGATATAKDLVKYSNTYRVCYGDNDLSVYTANLLSEQYGKVGLLYQADDPYLQAEATAFTDQFMEISDANRLVSRAFFPETTDFSAQLQAFRDADCEAVYLLAYSPQIIRFLSLAADMNFEADYFGMEAFLDTGHMDTPNDPSAALLKQVNYLCDFHLEHANDKAKAFIESYREAYDTDPSVFAAYAYDAIYVLYEAMKQTNITSLTISPGLLSQKLTDVFRDGFTYLGVTGEMSWSRNGSVIKEPLLISFS